MDGPPETRNPPEAATSEGYRSQSGEDQLNRKNTTRSVDECTRDRYRLDGQIKRILRADALKTAPDQFPANVHRTVGCTWCRIGEVGLVKPQQKNSYHWKGLATCGSVHACPICASKIQENRRKEVVQAIAYGKTIDRVPVMASFTFPHRVDQPLALLLKLQQAAIKSMRESRAYKELMKHCNYAGRIRSLEVTHGANGWHPHTHELLFLDPEVNPEYIRSKLSVLWLKACRKVGLFVPERDNEADFLRYSVDARSGNDAVGDYLAKMDDQNTWGISHEMTKSSSKQGRLSGVHPFKLATQDSTSHLFVEYVRAMKGQRQLVWSRGLKKLAGVLDKSDEQIAAEEVTKADDRIPVPIDAWRYVLGNDARWELTVAAKYGGGAAVAEYLHQLGYDSPEYFEYLGYDPHKPIIFEEYEHERSNQVTVASPE